jgi:1,4-alpha-glucan branching enzyme
MHQTHESLPARRPSYRTIRISATAHGAKEVIVTGDFTGWAKEGVRLAHKGSGQWETSLQLAPGDYEYRLIIDGRWEDHPDARKRVPNPFGSHNCVLTVH